MVGVILTFPQFAGVFCSGELESNLVRCKMHVHADPQLELEPIVLDSIVLTPMNVVSQISSDDQYHYGFNEQMKANE